MPPAFREIDLPRDEAALVALLTGSRWPHRVKPEPTPQEAREELARQGYGSASTLGFLIELDGEVAGLVGASDCGDERQDPQLDFRVREDLRGRGIGRAAIGHITREVFERHRVNQRIEGQTRRDNVAMRRLFLGAGYVKECVFRQAWPGEGGPYDGIGYAILRSDWETGTATPVDWAEEPV